ncbi:toprim domain-containing protein [Hymenobacter sp. BRD67]|uniref:toprim domain-containing protein n=1 Tax=Hymenobacter sp. BRD67 TaxID=2675877 RepID=UPI00156640CE|nr:toprim domain-containing protein [Hymenobacter sp. BRD67]QKG55014.1 toprim domain-containing protein [Hymenobacter sp. BRD67]
MPPCASSWLPTSSWSASRSSSPLSGFDSRPGFRRRGWFVPILFHSYARNPSPRDNDPQELDRFKQSIDLVDYATRRHGYDVKKAGPRGHWHQLEKDGEMLIVSRKGDHQVYLNPGDDRDSGSIIDFVKTRENQTLGQVRQTLRQYLGESDQSTTPGWQAAPSPPLPAPAAYAPKATEPADVETEAERRARLVAAVMGTHAALTDRSYLHNRHLSNETIDSPAFQGRVFTSQQGNFRNTAFPLYNEHGIATVEQRNDDYKHLLQLPKTGVWVSHPTDGKDTAVQRLVVSESPVDAMSYHQLHHQGAPGQPNTLYVATSGTVTERQVELIQKLIDKQEPKEVVLANDNDAAGRRFNMNYLNELQTPRRAREVSGGQVAYDEAPRPVEWHATAAGKYHTALRVEFHHATRAEGTEHLSQLTEQVQQLRLQAGENIGLEVQRATRQETVVRLVVPNADSHSLEELARTLHDQRETQRGQLERDPQGPGRQPENFLRAEYAISKDFNRDLELLSQGLSREQVAQQARADELAREQQRQERARQEQEQRQQVQQRETEREQAAQSPEVQRREAEQQRQAAALGLAAVTGDPALQRTVQLTVTESTPADEATPSQAQQMRELLRMAGAAVELRAETDPASGQLRSELDVRYHPHATPGGVRQLSQTLDALDKSPLVTLTEPADEQAERRRLAAPPEQSVTKTAIIRIDEPEPRAGATGHAEAVAEQLRAGGLNTGSLRSATDPATHQRHSEIEVSYRLDQPNLARVSATLDEVARQAGAQVHEHASDRAERHRLVPNSINANALAGRTTEPER